MPRGLRLQRFKLSAGNCDVFPFNQRRQPDIIRVSRFLFRLAQVMLEQRFPSSYSLDLAAGAEQLPADIEGRFRDIHFM
ncbi:hypothetical protein D3C75_1217780 [compost metagenome]